MVKNILFDLDGTLLVMKDQEKFINLYFEALCKRFCKPLSLSPKELTNGVWQGTKAMFINDGKVLNKEKFWEVFAEICGEKVLAYEDDFNDFYSTDFIYAKQCTEDNPLAQSCVELLKNKGYNVFLATNPVFPIEATASRIKWAGVDPELFQYITVYDNSSFCKPSHQYYNEILEKYNLTAQECLMVGNDVDEDMSTYEMGMETYLVTDCLENKHNKDYSKFRQGTFEDFYKFAKNMPNLK